MFIMVIVFPAFAFFCALSLFVRLLRTFAGVSNNDFHASVSFSGVDCFRAFVRFDVVVAYLLHRCYIRACHVLGRLCILSYLRLRLFQRVLLGCALCPTRYPVFCL